MLTRALTPAHRRSWAGICTLAALLVPHGVAHAESYRHDALGVSLRVPSGFTGDAMQARTRPGVLSAWFGPLGSAFASLVLEHVDAAQTATADDVIAQRLVEVSLIGARCDELQREKVAWRGRALVVLVGLVDGDVGREAHAVVDVPLVGGGALRIRLSTAATQREDLLRLLRATVSTLVVRAPAR